MANMKSVVSLAVRNGFTWERRDYTGEVVSFSVMKKVRGVDILPEPIAVRVMINDIAAPLAAQIKPIRGVISETPDPGRVLPEFSKYGGMGFLHEGQEVEVNYDTKSHTGWMYWEDLKKWDD